MDVVSPQEFIEDTFLIFDLDEDRKLIGIECLSPCRLSPYVFRIVKKYALSIEQSVELRHIAGLFAGGEHHQRLRDRQALAE